MCMGDKFDLVDLNLNCRENIVAHKSHTLPYTHGCQNHNLDRRIARFYDHTSPKRLESHKDRKNCRITCRIV